MKAAICDRYGPPENVYFADVPKPVPGDNDILVKTRATTVNSGDARLRSASFPAGMAIPVRLAMGFVGPRVKTMGFDAAGEVEAVGKNVTDFKPGDRVLASNGFKLRAHAEYLLVEQKGVVVRIPDTMSFEDAAALPFGGITSLVFFKQGSLKPGEDILINGASGAVGVLAIQIAKALGARVTAVCSAGNADLVRSLGAETVIDYRQTDIRALSGRYDVIMDNHGTAPYAKVKHLLAPGGRYLMVIGTLWEMMTGRFNKSVITADDTDEAFSAETYNRLLGLVADGQVWPVIGKTLPFDDIVEAYRLVDTGHKIGALVLTLSGPGRKSGEAP